MTVGKVLFTASVFSHLRQFHLPYIRAFAERGWRVDAACGGEIENLPGVTRHISLPLQKKMLSPKNLAAAAELRREIEAGDYDMIAAHTSLAAFFTRLPLNSKRRPLVINMVHGYLFDDETPFIKRRILLDAERMTAGKTDLLLTMNGWDDALARRFRLGGRIERIPGVGADFSFIDKTPRSAGAELRRELGIPREAFVLIYAAEFSKRKSQSVLIRAMERLPENAYLVLAGKGDLLEACRELARPLGGRVIFPGHLQNMGGAYRMADAALSSSRSEGLPFNVMEAMYAGLPVVASAVKGNADLIDDGKTGFLYPYGSAEDCAAAVKKLMDAPETAARMGAAAHIAAEKYSLGAVFPEVWAQYSALIERIERRSADREKEN